MQLLLTYALLLLTLLPPHNSLPSPPPLSDSSALLSFKSSADPSGLLLPSTDPCRWRGISCSPSHRVLRLVLENLGLNGTLPSSTLTLLDQLRILSLKSNSLSGPIPDLSPLLSLKSLFLSHNLLSGPFPSSLVSLHRLRNLDLSHNLLSGSIPPALASLERLSSLRLDSNFLSGPLPFLNQSGLRFFNVSANDLSGPVPATAALSAFGAEAFEGNAGLCGAVVRRECGLRFPFFKASAAAPSPGKQRQGLVVAESGSAAKGMNKKAVVAAGLLGCSAVLVLVVVVVRVRRRRRRRRRRKRGLGKNVVSDVGGGESTAEEVEERCNELVAAAAEAVTEEKMKKLGKSGCLVFCAGESQVYSMEQLMRASAEMLGRGSVGSTYKAVVDSRLILCVKRVDAGRIGVAGKEGFERHMEAVGRLRHPNLVPLRAFFQAKEERLLVYDYQPNGSLHSLIHGMVGCFFFFCCCIC